VAYTKVIQSGSLVEEWVYEREPSLKRLRKTRDRIKRVFRQERRADNVTKCRNAFRRLVRANLSEGKPPALLTLNMKEITGIHEAYLNFTRFGVGMRKTFGADLKWIAVPEFQKRGAVHFHILIWGLPECLPCLFSEKFYTDKTGKKHRVHVCPEPRQCERKSRRIAALWPVGFADIMQTNGSAKLSSYLAKYMSKAMHDKRLLGKRAYSATRNVVRPMSFNTPFQISSAKELWGIGPKTPIALSKEYATLFLGRCNYRSYLIESYECSESSIDAP